MSIKISHSMRRHDMEPLSTSLSLCEANLLVIDGFLSPRDSHVDLSDFCFCPYWAAEQTVDLPAIWGPIDRENTGSEAKIHPLSTHHSIFSYKDGRDITLGCSLRRRHTKFIVSQITDISTVCSAAFFRSTAKKISKICIAVSCDENQPPTGDSLHKRPVMLKVLPYHYIIMPIVSKSRHG